MSPHLDDVALSCAGFLAARPGSVMVTVFAGGPTAVDPLPWWDRECGVFVPGDDVVGLRREEDRRGAAELSATVRHLDHWDSQYRDRADYGYDGPGTEGELVDAVVADLEHVVEELDLEKWLVPLGIFHPDHRVTATACQQVAGRHPEVAWLVYEDLPYATLLPQVRRAAVETLGRRGFSLATARPADLDAASHRRRAAACYRSQHRGLGQHLEAALATDERIHALVGTG